jgi:hypothetical protein
MSESVSTNNDRGEDGKTNGSSSPVASLRSALEALLVTSHAQMNVGGLFE